MSVIGPALTLPLPARLEVHRKIGEGAFGNVFEVYDREQQSRVALKSLERLDAHSLFRFKREFRDLADITHPNLVRLHELFCYEDRWFFTMDLIRGVSFIEHVRPGSAYSSDAPTVDRNQGASGAVDKVVSVTSSGAVDERRLRDALLQLTEGVGALHEAGKLHRDLKPQNVLVDGDGRVVVLDFGLLDDIHPDLRNPEEPYEIVGTPAYMAPEAAAGQSDGAESDWYSVGVILYEALTGQLPYEGKPTSMLLRKQTTDPVNPEPLVSRSMRDLARLSVLLLSRSADQRPTLDDIRATLLSGTSRVVVGSYESDPWRRDGAAAVMTRHPAEFLVGRDGQLAQLADALQTVESGRGVMVRVHGRSGMGKSALIRSFVDDLRRSGRAVPLLGRCFECESVPYKALDSLVDALTQRLLSMPTDELASLLPPHLGPLTRLFPVLRRVPQIAEAGPVSELDGAEPQEVRQSAFTALRLLLRRLAATKPLVLWIDDLQWGDEDSAAFLVDLLQPPDAPQLLLIVSHRAEDVDTSSILRVLLSSLPQARYELRELEVGPLADADCQQLALLLLGEHDVRRSLPPVDFGSESGGSPLYVLQLVRHACRVGVTDGALDDLVLEDVLWEHVGSLSEPAQRLLQTIALAGRSIELSVARKAAGLREELRDALDVLRMQRLVRTQGMRGPDLVEPYHDRVREVISARLDADTRRSRHRALAEALEATGRADPEALVVHYRAAGNTDMAWKYAVSAAERAASALAFRRAADLYREALALDAGRDAHAMGVKLADALANAGHGAEASEEYLAALATASGPETLVLRRKAAEQALRVGHVDQGLSLLEDMLAASGMKLAETPARALASVLARRAWLRIRGFGYRGRYKLDEEALRRIDIGWALVTGLSNSDVIRGADIHVRTLLLALETGEPTRIARGLALEAAMVATNGPKNRARVAKLLDASFVLAEKHGDPYAVGWAHCGAGAAAYFEGRFQDAIDAGERVHEVLSHCAGATWERTTARHYAIWSLFWLGRVREAADRVYAQLKAAIERGDLYSATDLRLFTSNMAWLVDDDVEGARRAVEEAIGGWSKKGFHAQHYYALYARVQIDIYAGDGVTGLRRLAEAWPSVKESLLMQVQSVRLELLHARSRCALVAMVQNPDQERESMRSVEADADKMAGERSAFSLPLAELARAPLALVLGDEARCARHLRSAIAGFKSAGMGQYAAAAARRLGALGGDGAEALAAEGTQRMRDEGIRDIERWTDLLAPGFEQKR